MNTRNFDLEGELRRQASAIRPEVPRDLSRPISAAITAAAAEGGLAGAVRQHWALWGGLGGAVAAALVGAFVFRAPTAQVDPHADAVALAQEVQGMPRRVLASLETSPAGEDPLNEEATALKSSAQSALGFLAYNFLPATSG